MQILFAEIGPIADLRRCLQVIGRRLEHVNIQASGNGIEFGHAQVSAGFQSGGRFRYWTGIDDQVHRAL